MSLATQSQPAGQKVAGGNHLSAANDEQELTPTQLAERWHATNDQRALQLQAQANRRDVHCWRAY